MRGMFRSTKTYRRELRLQLPREDRTGQQFPSAGSVKLESCVGTIVYRKASGTPLFRLCAGRRLLGMGLGGLRFLNERPTWNYWRVCHR
jgi:hypothetical protein